jgi:hypothetical protein
MENYWLKKTINFLKIYISWEQEILETVAKVVIGVTFGKKI